MKFVATEFHKEKPPSDGNLTGVILFRKQE